MTAESLLDNTDQLADEIEIENTIIVVLCDPRFGMAIELIFMIKKEPK